LSNPITKSHFKTKVSVAYVWGAPKKFGVPLDIFAIAETSDFKFGTQLEFAN